MAFLDLEISGAGFFNVVSRLEDFNAQTYNRVGGFEDLAVEHWEFMAGLQS